MCRTRIHPTLWNGFPTTSRQDPQFLSVCVVWQAYYIAEAGKQTGIAYHDAILNIMRDITKGYKRFVPWFISWGVWAIAFFCNVSCCWTYWTNTRIEGIQSLKVNFLLGWVLKTPRWFAQGAIQPVGKGVPILVMVRRNWLTFRYLTFGRPPCATFLPKDWRWLWPLLEIPLRFRRCSKELPSGLFLHFFRGKTTISSAVFRLVELFRVLLQLSSQRYVRMVYLNHGTCFWFRVLTKWAKVGHFE